MTSLISMTTVSDRKWERTYARVNCGSFSLEITSFTIPLFVTSYTLMQHVNYHLDFSQGQELAEGKGFNNP